MGAWHHRWGTSTAEAEGKQGIGKMHSGGERFLVGFRRLRIKGQKEGTDGSAVCDADTQAMVPLVPLASGTKMEYREC